MTTEMAKVIDLAKESHTIKADCEHCVIPSYNAKFIIHTPSGSEEVGDFLDLCEEHMEKFLVSNPAVVDAIEKGVLKIYTMLKENK